MDVLTPEQRLRCMRANKSSDTKPERAFARLLWSAGVRYRKQSRDIPGRPDFSIKRYRLAIFVDGDFWHGRDFSRDNNRFHHNRDFWIAKIERNIGRDRKVNAQLEAAGWKVLRFWESDIKKNPGACLEAVLEYLAGFTSLSAPAYLPADLPPGTYDQPPISSSPAPYTQDSSMSEAAEPAARYGEDVE